MNKTNIEWCKNPDGSQGYTWNPITGCLNGCEYCYARKLANGRLKARYLGNDNWVTKHADPERIRDPFYPRFWPEKVSQPFEYKKPSGIFTCNMSDLFGIGIPQQWTDRVLGAMEDSPQHRFYLLTKQPQNIIRFSPFPDNCWVGVSATKLQMFLDSGNILKSIEAKVKYISIEPLLDWSIDRVGILPDYLKRFGISWLIIGAQTKPTIYPRIEWIREIVEAADRARVPVFLKDNLDKLIIQSIQKGEISRESTRTGYSLRQEMPS